MNARESGPKTVDLLVIGGGINGACIARDAAGRGLDVLLCEKDDLAAHTSSASTKLIHGGLRYLEHYDFRLVRHSLREREVLLRNAPHIIWPLRFVLPHHAGLRPRWMIRLGLFLYDHLGGRERLPPCASIDLRRHPGGHPLKKHYRRAYEYSDCWVQDARLVVLAARDAHLRGADVRTRTECVSLARRGPHWEATLVDGTTGARSTVSARGVVNASGPWIGRRLDPGAGAGVSAGTGAGADAGTKRRMGLVKDGALAEGAASPDIADAKHGMGLVKDGTPAEEAASPDIADAKHGSGLVKDGAPANGAASPDAVAAKYDVRLVKGSHIVVRKVFDHPFPYIFQSADGRVLFAIPFEGDYTLLGTTEVEIEGGPGPVAITPGEVDYICAAANAYFEEPISPGDVVWSYSGIRPLLDDRTRNASEITRDYVLHLDRGPAPMLSVYGGKITTCRRLAEQAVDMLAGPLGFDRPAWTRDAPLPGGDVPGGDVEGFIAHCIERYPWLAQGLVRHYVRHYGTGIHTLLAGRASAGDLGEHFGAGLHAAEVEYLVEHEWARTAEDVLWRRTKKGLRMTEDGKRRLRVWLDGGVSTRSCPTPA